MRSRLRSLAEANVSRPFAPDGRREVDHSTIVNRLGHVATQPAQALSEEFAMSHNEFFTIAVLATVQVTLLAALGSKLKLTIKGMQLELTWRR